MEQADEVRGRKRASERTNEVDSGKQEEEETDSDADGRTDAEGLGNTNSVVRSCEAACGELRLA